MYSEKVMDHFNNPRNVGEIENPSGVGTVGNVKVHCSLLAEEAIHAALWDYAEKNHITIEGLEKPVNDISEKEEGEEEEY